MTVASYFVSVVVPLANDGDVLEPFVEELLASLRAGWMNYEVLLIDDGSRDGTRDAAVRLLAQHECLRYIRLSRRFGPEVALLAGMDNVIGDVVVVLQAESDPPALLPRFVETARANGGVAFGVRSTPLGEGPLYNVARRAVVRFAAALLELDLPADATLYMAFTRQALNAINQIRDKSRTLRVFGAVIGFPRQRIEYEPVPRRQPVRRKSLRDGVRRALSLIVMNSTRPLRWVSLLGVMASSFSLAYALYAVGIALWKAHVAEGWTTLSLAISGLFFVQFLILAVACEYLGRLLEESRDRPAYFVAEERASSVLVADATRRNVVHGSS